MRMGVCVRVRDHRVRVDQLRQHLQRPAQVPVVLDDHVRGLRQQVRGELRRAQHGQRAGPVDGLGDAGRLSQVQVAQATDHLDEGLRQGIGQAGVLGPDDGQLTLGVRVVQRQVQAPALQCRRQIPGVVGGQHDERLMPGPEGAELGHGDLVLGEQFEQDRLQRLVGPVHLVDEQDDGLGGSYRLQQRPRGEELLGKEDALLRRDPGHGLAEALGVADDLADLLPQQLRVQQLLAVVPFVERGGLVLALVALQPEQPAPGDLGQGLGQLGLADPGRPFQQDRLAQPRLQEHGGGQPLVREVAVAGEAVDDFFDRAEDLTSRLAGRARPPGPASSASRAGVTRGGRPGRRSCCAPPPDGRSRTCTPWRCPACRRPRARAW